MLHDPQITNHESPFASAQGKPVTDLRSDVRSALRDAMAQLERERIPSAPLTAELLLMHALGRDRTFLYAHPEHELDAATRERYSALIAKRASGVPTQYLTGHQEFWGLDFEVTPDVLIPRPETEHVIEVTLQRLDAAVAGAASQRDLELRFADIGTGSGCIAIALAHELSSARITATDISAAALEVARRNAARHGAASRIDFVECNLLDALLHESRFTNHPSDSLMASQSRRLDLIVSNPPYIGRKDAVTLPREVREHEPESALIGGETGTEMYAPLIAQAAKLLKSGGILVLELGYNSADDVSRLLNTNEWSDVAITNDLAGIKRVASARRSS